MKKKVQHFLEPVRHNGRDFQVGDAVEGIDADEVAKLRERGLVGDAPDDSEAAIQTVGDRTSVGERRLVFAKPHTLNGEDYEEGDDVPEGIADHEAETLVATGIARQAAEPTDDDAVAAVAPRSRKKSR